MRCKRERSQRASFLSEGLVDDPAGCRMHPRIGDRVQPLLQLDVEVCEIPERTGKEEVFTDVAEWPFDFPLRLRPVGTAGARLIAVMPGEIEQGAVLDHEPVRVLADDGSLH